MNMAFTTSPNIQWLTRDLERVNSMSALWDDAANALSRRDYAGFDRAMSAFRELNFQSTVRDGERAKTSPVNK